METLLTDFGLYWHNIITQLQQICQRHVHDENLQFHHNPNVLLWTTLDEMYLTKWLLSVFYNRKHIKCIYRQWLIVRALLETFYERNISLNKKTYSSVWEICEPIVFRTILTMWWQSYPRLTKVKIQISVLIICSWLTVSIHMICSDKM